MFFFTHNSYVIYKCDLWIIRVKNVNHMICSCVFFFTCWLIYFNVIFWVFLKKFFLQHIIDLLGKIWIKWIIWFIHVILFNVIRLFSHVTYFYIWFLSYLKCESYNSFTFVCFFFIRMIHFFHVTFVYIWFFSCLKYESHESYDSFLSELLIYFSQMIHFFSHYFLFTRAFVAHDLFLFTWSHIIHIMSHVLTWAHVCNVMLEMTTC